MEQNDNGTTSIKKKTIVGFVWRFFERISAQLVSFIVTVILARILVPEEYGIIAIVTVFIAIADVLVTSGLSTSLVQKKDADDLDFSTIFYTSIFLAIVMYIVLIFTAPLIAKFYKTNLLTPVCRVMGIRLLLSAVNSVQQAYVSRNLIFKKFFIATLLGTVISAIIGIIMAKKGFGVWALVAQQLINPFVDIIVLFIIVDWHPRFLFSFSRLKILFSYGWKVMCANLCGTFFNKLRNLIIGAKYDQEALAYYNRGESLPILVTSNITATLESVLFPAMAKFQDDKNKLKSAIRRSMSLGSYILMPVLFGLAACAKNIVLILFSEKWLPAVPFVQVVCMQELTDLLNSINLQAIKATGRSNVLLILEFIKKPIYLLIIFITIQVSPFFMGIGVAVYGLIALFINSYPNFKYLSYSFIEQIQDVIVSILFSIIMYVVVVCVGLFIDNMYLEFFTQIITGVSVYVILSLVTKNQNLKYIVELIKR